MQKCESTKVNMYKMRKFDVEDFAFYTLPFSVNVSHFRIIWKKTRVHRQRKSSGFY